MSVGISFLCAFSCLRLRIDNDLLCLGLCIDHADLLTKLCFGNISILTEVEFLELLVLSVAVGLYNCCDEELFKRNAVFCKIIYKEFLDGFRENGKIFVNLENIDSVRLHHLRDVGLNSRHKEGAEEAYELLLTEEVFCSYQFKE